MTGRTLTASDNMLVRMVAHKLTQKMNKMGFTLDEEKPIAFRKKMRGPQGVELDVRLHIRIDPLSREITGPLTIEVGDDLSLRFPTKETQQLDLVSDDVYDTLRTAFKDLPLLMERAEKRLIPKSGNVFVGSALVQPMTFTPINKLVKNEQGAEPITAWILQFIPASPEGIVMLEEIARGLVDIADGKLVYSQEVDIAALPATVGDILAHVAPVVENMPTAATKEIIAGLFAAASA